MFKNQFRCKICDRPMPPRVYEAHLKKSHTPEEVQGQVDKNEKELVEITQTFTKDTFKEIAENKNNKSFDWGEVYPCNTCGEEYPAKAMPFHSWVKHRI